MAIHKAHAAVGSIATVLKNEPGSRDQQKLHEEIEALERASREVIREILAGADPEKLAQTTALRDSLADVLKGKQGKFTQAEIKAHRRLTKVKADLVDALENPVRGEDATEEVMLEGAPPKLEVVSGPKVLAHVKEIERLLGMVPADQAAIESEIREALKEVRNLKAGDLSWVQSLEIQQALVTLSRSPVLTLPGYEITGIGLTDIYRAIDNLQRTGSGVQKGEVSIPTPHGRTGMDEVTRGARGPVEAEPVEIDEQETRPFPVGQKPVEEPAPEAETSAPAQPEAQRPTAEEREGVLRGLQIVQDDDVRAFEDSIRLLIAVMHGADYPEFAGWTPEDCEWVLREIGVETANKLGAGLQEKGAQSSDEEPIEALPDEALGPVEDEAEMEPERPANFTEQLTTLLALKGGSRDDYLMELGQLRKAAKGQKVREYEGWSRDDLAAVFEEIGETMPEVEKKKEPVRKPETLSPAEFEKAVEDIKARLAEHPEEREGTLHLLREAAKGGDVKGARATSFAKWRNEDFAELADRIEAETRPIQRTKRPQAAKTPVSGPAPTSGASAPQAAPTPTVPATPTTSAIPATPATPPPATGKPSDSAEIVREAEAIREACGEGKPGWAVRRALKASTKPTEAVTTFEERGFIKPTAAEIERATRRALELADGEPLPDTADGLARRGVKAEDIPLLLATIERELNRTVSVKAGTVERIRAALGVSDGVVNGPEPDAVEPDTGGEATGEAAAPSPEKCFENEGAAMRAALTEATKERPQTRDRITRALELWENVPEGSPIGRELFARIAPLVNECRKYGETTDEGERMILELSAAQLADAMDERETQTLLENAEREWSIVGIYEAVLGFSTELQKDLDPLMAILRADPNDADSAPERTFLIRIQQRVLQVLTKDIPALIATVKTGATVQETVAAIHGASLDDLEGKEQQIRDKIATLKTLIDRLPEKFKKAKKRKVTSTPLTGGGSGGGGGGGPVPPEGGGATDAGADDDTDGANGAGGDQSAEDGGEEVEEITGEHDVHTGEAEPEDEETHESGEVSMEHVETLMANVLGAEKAKAFDPENDPASLAILTLLVGRNVDMSALEKSLKNPGAELDEDIAKLIEDHSAGELKKMETATAHDLEDVKNSITAQEATIAKERNDKRREKLNKELKAMRKLRNETEARLKQIQAARKHRRKKQEYESPRDMLFMINAFLQGESIENMDYESIYKRTKRQIDSARETLSSGGWGALKEAKKWTFGWLKPTLTGTMELLAEKEEAFQEIGVEKMAELAKTDKEYGKTKEWFQALSRKKSKEHAYEVVLPRLLTYLEFALRDGRATSHLNALSAGSAERLIANLEKVRHEYIKKKVDDRFTKLEQEGHPSEMIDRMNAYGIALQEADAEQGDIGKKIITRNALGKLAKRGTVTTAAGSALGYGVALVGLAGLPLLAAAAAPVAAAGGLAVAAKKASDKKIIKAETAHKVYRGAGYGTAMTALGYGAVALGAGPILATIVAGTPVAVGIYKMIKGDKKKK